MRRFFRWGWLVVTLIVVVPPALFVALDNDVIRLVAGLTGVRWGPLLLTWLGLGFVLSGFGVLRVTDAPRLRIAFGALVAASCISIALHLSRGSVRTREVHFARGETTYGATLYLPAATKKSPLVVFVPGSAGLTRAFYDLWAERIARAGIAVLVSDKRGVGETSGHFENQNNGSRANLTLLAQDVVAAVDHAATLPEVDSTRIGLVGFSQAGWVAPLAATLSSRIRYMAIISGPAVSIREEGQWSDWRGDDEGAARYSRADAERMMDTVTRRGVDARVLLGGISIPGLWLYGADDNSVPVLTSVRVLDSLRTFRQKPFDVDTFARHGHLLIGRDGRLLPRIAPASWTSLTRWLELKSRE